MTRQVRLVGGPCSGHLWTVEVGATAACVAYFPRKFRQRLVRLYARGESLAHYKPWLATYTWDGFTRKGNLPRFRFAESVQATA